MLKNVNNPKLHLQYAKAREADGSYREVRIEADGDEHVTSV